MKFTILLRYPDERPNPFDWEFVQQSNAHYVAYVSAGTASAAQGAAQLEAFRRQSPADRRGKKATDFAVVCTIEGHVTIRPPGSAWISPQKK